jgi:hypothetical protein
MNPDEVARILANHTRTAFGRCRGCVLIATDRTTLRRARAWAWITAPSWRSCNVRKVAADAQSRIVHPGGAAGAALVHWAAWRNV